MAEGIATRSSRGHRTICLPIKEGTICESSMIPRRFGAPDISAPIPPEFDNQVSIRYIKYYVQQV